MRCPKCGYISFDLVDECLKCKKNIKSASEVLQGSVLKIAPPSFLKFSADTKETNELETDFADEISPMESDYADDESDFLTSDVDFSEDETGEFEIESESLEASDFEEDVSLEEEIPEGEIEVDLSQFEEVSDPEAAFLSDDADVSLDTDEDVLEISVPDELVDMSDLDPPKLVVEEEESVDIDVDVDLGLDSEPDDLDLGELNFDLSLDDGESEKKPDFNPVEETVLSLDDIDFSDALSEEGELSDNKASGSMDMDGDLDFDLDLGGLSIHKDH